LFNFIFLENKNVIQNFAMNHLRLFTTKELGQLLSRREGETKLGETIQLPDSDNWELSLRSGGADFVLLGIPEDIGVRANGGVGGTQTLWRAALKALLNVQDTELLQGKKLFVLGSFHFSEMMQQSQRQEVATLRSMVSKIDDIVFPVIKSICDAGKIPIVIGGGHNNAYPILKGLSRSKGQPVNCINLDAHTDYRAIEGRHSGNGFRYAKMDGYLKRYAMVGLHRNYNSQQVINEITSDPDIHFSFYEDLFLQKKTEFKTALDNATHFLAGSTTGIELDLDCIERMLSSAATPCGLTSLQARQYLQHAVLFSDTGYLHIAEGCTEREDGVTDPLAAKLVAYLISDFIRTATNKQSVTIKETEV